MRLYGAGGSPSTWSPNGHAGGSGGFVSAILTLPYGTSTIEVIVGGAGKHPSTSAAWPDGGLGGPDGANHGGGGGGRSALRLTAAGGDIRYSRRLSALSTPVLPATKAQLQPGQHEFCITCMKP